MSDKSSSSISPPLETLLGSTMPPLETLLDSTIPPPETVLDSTTPPHETLLGSTTPPPEILLDSTTQPLETLLSSTTPPLEILLDSTTPPPATLLGSTTPPPKTLLDSTTPPLETLFGSTTPPPETLLDLTTPPLETLFGSTTSPPKTLLDSTIPTLETLFGSTTPHLETHLDSTNPPLETLSSSTTQSPETLLDSTTPPPETLLDSTTPPPETLFGSTTPPHETLPGSTTPPLETLLDSTTPPLETLLDSTTPPPETILDSTNPPLETLLDSTTLNQNLSPNPISSLKENSRSVSNEHDPTTTINNPLAPFDLNELPKPMERPKGSKNKGQSNYPIMVPRPPPETTRKDLLIEIPQGCDIMQMVQKYAQDYFYAGIVVKNGFGKVRNVSLKSHSACEPPIHHYGTFDLVSLSGVNLGRPASVIRGETSGTSCSYFDHGSRVNYMTVVMAGSKGNIFGGTVVGKLIALSNVILFASIIKEYEFHEMMPDIPEYTIRHPYTSGADRSTEEGSSSSSSSNLSSRGSESTEDMTWEPKPSSSKRVRLSGKMD